MLHEWLASVRVVHGVSPITGAEKAPYSIEYLLGDTTVHTSEFSCHDQLSGSTSYVIA
jgi:hypothetical protein